MSSFFQRIEGAEESAKEFCDKLIQGAARLGESPDHLELTKKLPIIMLLTEKHLRFHCVLCCISMGDFEAAEEVASFLYGTDNTDRREQDTALLYLYMAQNKFAEASIVARDAAVRAIALNDKTLFGPMISIAEAHCLLILGNLQEAHTKLLQVEENTSIASPRTKLKLCVIRGYYHYMKRELSQAFDCIKPVVSGLIDLESMMFQDVYMLIPFFDICSAVVADVKNKDRHEAFGLWKQVMPTYESGWSKFAATKGSYTVYKARLTLSMYAMEHPDQPVPPPVLTSVKTKLENALKDISKYDLPFEQGFVHAQLALSFDSDVMSSDHYSEAISRYKKVKAIRYHMDLRTTWNRRMGAKSFDSVGTGLSLSSLESF
eukprot:Phypoly_transcript_09796.p1 GENE.Phypoly_transcript_09796~~Phypoly_transcript_09796.p1  ORF type:complete len:425 (+),score=40.16 Phypoly_transcript_09796:152-1276(+)